jgi:hypothetical protein
MKKDKKFKKLTLSFETLRRLDDRSLVFAGAYYPSGVQCTLQSCPDATCGCPNPDPSKIQCTLYC